MVFTLILLLMILLQSYGHFSTSLLSVLPQSEGKELLKNFDKTQNAKILLLSVKGFDEGALKTLKNLKNRVNALPWVLDINTPRESTLNGQESTDVFACYPLNREKLHSLDVKGELGALYDEMHDSFFPVAVDKNDPFKLLTYPKTYHPTLKEGELTLGDYGYLAYFKLSSKSLETHQKLYKQLHEIVQGHEDVHLFSPLFYYVENSQAIRSDVNHIILLALSILLLLYLFILRDLSLLFNVLATLGSSAMFASILLTEVYDEVSIFVFVFGVSISSIAIDYMFHHYLHGHYAEKKTFNKEVFYGFFTTTLAFFILSFSSFILIKQIALFSIFSLIFSYLIFAFLYPKIQFKTFHSRVNIFHKNIESLNAKVLLFVSLSLILFSLFFIRFDFNVKNLDYDNHSLKQSEAFFNAQMKSPKRVAFAIKAESIDTLITQAQTLQTALPSVQLPLSNYMSKERYSINKNLLSTLDTKRHELEIEAKNLGFKEGYFDNAYRLKREFVPYDIDTLKEKGIDIFKTDGAYFTYGRVEKSDYAALLQYDFTQSLSLKEHFEASLSESMLHLFYLGVLSLAMIILLIYLSARKSFVYALLFLLFPLSMIALYACFVPINILHLFMMFIILAIGIDYAIYMSKKSDRRTKEAIAYSLISTFAGFGVLVFSQISALFSLGIVASIGLL
ncbi:MAG: hypothetical protein GQ531_04980, partial [Sulfurovum sp.]|nr:hypothetical protein [Sulfurovum sp.]